MRLNGLDFIVIAAFFAVLTAVAAASFGWVVVKQFKSSGGSALKI